MMDHQTHLRNLAVSAYLDDGCWGFRILGQDGGDFQRDSCPQKARDEALSSLRSQLGLEFEDFPLGEMTDTKGDAGSLPHNTDCNPRVLLNNLVFLEQKIHDLQGVVRSMIVGDRGTDRSEKFLIRQQMVRADIASIIAQLLAVAGRLVPAGKQVGRCREFESGTLFSHMDDWIGTMSNLQRMGAVSGVDDDIKIGNMGIDFGQLQDDDLSADILGKLSEIELPVELSRSSDDTTMVLEELKKIGTNQCEPSLIRINEAGNVSAGDVEYNGVVKDEDDDGEDENLVPGSYEVLELDRDEILAPHTHFCTVCGKGFKRDANLRMHMRGHGDEYKTPEALAKPNKDSKSESSQLRRYSCPFEGCKRNQKHKKFQPLKTILCVKNHYKRSHCDKRYTCSRCHMKKFSVIADLKTHEKHCGQDRWQCSCGTTFSRKDKLFGHVALFQGHTPAIPPNETKGSVNSDGAGKMEKLKNGGAVANASLSLSATEQGVAGGDYIPSVNLNGDSGYERGAFVRTCPAPINISFGNGLNRDNFTGGSSVTERFVHSTSNMIGGSFPLQSRISSSIFQSNVASPNSNAL